MLLLSILLRLMQVAGNFARVSMFLNFVSPFHVSHDLIFSYVATAGDNISIFNSKSFEAVAKHAAKDVTSVCFTPLAQSLVAIDRKGFVTLYK